MEKFSQYLLIFLFSYVSCGDLGIRYAPSSLIFDSAATLRFSDLDDVVSSSMGYSSQGTGWRGLKVTDPFNYPTAAVVIGITSEGLPIKQTGTNYQLKDDSTLEAVRLQVSDFVGPRAQRPTHFRYIKPDDLKNITVVELKEIRHLDNDVKPDSLFLQEMINIGNIMESMLEKPKTGNEGQDFLFIELDEIAKVVQTYGKKSPKVAEAIEILKNQLTLLEEQIREYYNDDVVIYVVNSKDVEPHSRRVRSLLQEPGTKTDLNLVDGYSEDYPAIFNIVLFLAIILVVAILATSFSMAYMDPGRDSIIYRMTNLHMKKDM